MLFFLIVSPGGPPIEVQRGLEEAIKILEDEFDKVESTKADVSDLQNRKLPEADQKLLLVSLLCSPSGYKTDVCLHPGQVVTTEEQRQVSSQWVTISWFLYQLRPVCLNMPLRMQRLVSKAEAQIKSSTRACSKVTTAESTAKNFGIMKQYEVYTWFLRGSDSCQTIQNSSFRLLCY